MIELMPFQQRAVNQLLALGTRKLVIADPGVGARTIMARASKEFNDKIVIAPVVLKNEWERLLGVSMKFISLNTPYAIDKVRGYRLPLAMVEISVLTDLKLDLILELLTRMDNVWVRLMSISEEDLWRMQIYGFEVVRIKYNGL